MKKKLLILCMLLVGCQEYTPKMQYLSVIIDRTEQDSYVPSSKDIFSYLNDSHPSDGLELSLRYVGETRYAEKYQFILPKGETGWLSNENARRSKRRVLLSRFRDTLGHFKKRQHLRSEIFRLVVEEATYLSKQEGSSSILLFSDLKEHSSLFSIYDTKQLHNLHSSFDTVAGSFSRALGDIDLSRITIHILYTPKLKDDRVFTAMVAIYKTVFESRGATIHVIRNYTISIKP